MVESACIFYGDTPTCLFTSWRLSYTNISVINISAKLSSDGVISWKTDKLGSNFYTPNVFINNFLREMNDPSDMSILQNKLKGFQIDYLFLSCNSIFELRQACSRLIKVISDDTVVFVECSFGVNLDLLVYQEFMSNRENGCKIVVFGVLSNLEGRELGTDSFILLSNDIKFYFGLSYVQSLRKLSEEFLEYLKKVKEQLDGANSKLNIFVESLNSSGEEMIELSKTALLDNEFAIRIWNLVIPKIAFHIISIMYEDADFNHFREQNQSPARELSYNVLKELAIIAFYHCNCDFELLNPKGNHKVIIDSKFLPYIKTTNDIKVIDQLIDYKRCFQFILEKQKRVNDKSYSNTSPKFVSFSFEAYSFYNKIEYPASILLSQPFELAKKYKCQASYLQCLSQFYERLCILSCMPIYLTDTIKSIDGITDLSNKRQSIIFGKGNVLFNPASNNCKNNNNNMRPIPGADCSSKESLDSKRSRGRGNNSDHSGTFLYQQSSHKSSKTKGTSNNHESDCTLSKTSFESDVQSQLAEEIAALYFDNLDHANILNSISTESNGLNKTFQEKSASKQLNRCSVPSLRTYNSDNTNNYYPKGGHNSQKSNGSESDYSLTSNISEELLIDAKHSSSMKPFLKRHHLNDRDGCSFTNLPKKATFNSDSANNVVSESRSKISLAALKNDIVYQNDLSRQDHNKLKQGSSSSSFSRLNRYVTTNTDKELLHRLSHQFEAEDMSRYHYLYKEHFKRYNSLNEGQEDDADDDELKAKRKLIMQDISRFRRFKIDNKIKFGYGNNFLSNSGERKNLGCSVSFQQYMDILSAPLNVDIAEISSSRYGEADTITHLQKKNVDEEEKERDQNVGGEEQHMIEYPEE